MISHCIQHHLCQIYHWGHLLYLHLLTIQRPLGRTQSAPLPLDHPMLQSQAILLSPQQNEQYAREKRLCEQQQHNLLKQVPTSGIIWEGLCLEHYQVLLLLLVRLEDLRKRKLILLIHLQQVFCTTV
ncbi:uncharacterized protein [Parasteatoda tepidariorum]|uniref:uncharacterized protein isoform X1 n=1 Tax=Parasteatoda tepidariorum TaxID=114398 RepID=UPI001C71E6E4|nr:uncharacterized protein LOC122271685 isoform X1 [Parasteatoda tepidariorum]